MMQNPDSQLWIADSVTREILIGRRHRIQKNLDMLEKLYNREQMMVCVICDTEVQEMIEASNNLKYYHCPVCNEEVKAKLWDNDTIFARTQSLLKELRAEDSELRAWLVDMGWVNNPKKKDKEEKKDGQQAPTKSLPLLPPGKEGQQILEDSSKLSPMDTEELIERIRKDIKRLNEEIKRETAASPGDANV